MFEHCLYFNVNALARRVNAVWDEAFSEFNLSPAHAYLLQLILERPGLTQTEISKALQLEKSTITRFVGVLEEKQMISRDRQGREVLVFPTAKSYAIQNSLSDKGESLYQQLVSTIGQENLTNMVSGLRQFNKDLCR